MVNPRETSNRLILRVTDIVSCTKRAAPRGELNHIHLIWCSTKAELLEPLRSSCFIRMDSVWVIYALIWQINFALDNIALPESIFALVYSVIPSCRSSILIRRNEYSRVIARTVWHMKHKYSIFHIDHEMRASSKTSEICAKLSHLRRDAKRLRRR